MASIPPSSISTFSPIVSTSSTASSLQVLKRDHSALKTGQHEIVNPPLTFDLSAIRSPLPGIKKVTPHQTQETRPLTEFGLPPPPSNFTGREQLIQEIKKKIEKDQQVVLSGIGGAGKSTLASQVAHSLKRTFDFVWWITGPDPLTSYLDLSHTLNLFSEGDKPEVILTKVKAYLNKKNCLIIFDNVEDFGQLKQFFPNVTKQIICTSRNPFSDHDFPIPLFTEEDSLAFLHKIVPHREEEAVYQLVKELGGLPLALTQAAAYMKKTGTTYDSYLDLFRKRGIELLKKQKEPPDYDHTLLTTWTLSCDKIGLESPAALSLLYRTAYLGPTNIPKKLLAASEDEDLLDLNAQLELLQTYSLLQRSENNEFSIHSLTQLVLRSQRSAKEEEEDLSILAGAFNKEWLFDYAQPATWESSHRYFPHFEIFCKYIRNPALTLDFKSTLLNQISFYYSSMKHNFQAAIECLEEAASHLISTAPYHQEELAHTYRLMGLVKSDEGDYKRAIELFNVSLTHCHASNSLSTALVYFCIGDAYRGLNQYQKAKKIFLKIFDLNLSDVEKQTIEMGHVYNNLGLVHQCLGEMPEALDCLTKALELDQTHYGENHPYTATAYKNLGDYYLCVDPSSKLAYEAFEKSYQIRVAVFSNDELHPEVALAKMALSISLMHSGQFDLAEQHLKSALTTLLKVLPQDHHEIPTCYGHLGTLYFKMENYPLAIKCFTQALNIMKRTLSDCSNESAMFFGHRGCAYAGLLDFPKAIDDIEQAEALFKDLEDKQGRLENQIHLAYVYFNQGLTKAIQQDRTEGSRLLHHSLSTYQKVLPLASPQQKTIIQPRIVQASAYLKHLSMGGHIVYLDPS